MPSTHFLPVHEGPKNPPKPIPIDVDHSHPGNHGGRLVLFTLDGIVTGSTGGQTLQKYVMIVDQMSHPSDIEDDRYKCTVMSTKLVHVSVPSLCRSLTDNGDPTDPSLTPESEIFLETCRERRVLDDRGKGDIRMQLNALRDMDPAYSTQVFHVNFKDVPISNSIGSVKGHVIDMKNINYPVVLRQMKGTRFEQQNTFKHFHVTFLIPLHEPHKRTLGMPSQSVNSGIEDMMDSMRVSMDCICWHEPEMALNSILTRCHSISIVLQISSGGFVPSASAMGTNGAGFPYTTPQGPGQQQQHPTHGMPGQQQHPKHGTPGEQQQQQAQQPFMGGNPNPVVMGYVPQVWTGHPFGFSPPPQSNPVQPPQGHFTPPRQQAQSHQVPFSPPGGNPNNQGINQANNTG